MTLHVMPHKVLLRAALLMSNVDMSSAWWCRSVALMFLQIWTSRLGGGTAFNERRGYVKCMVAAWSCPGACMIECVDSIDYRLPQ